MQEHEIESADQQLGANLRSLRELKGWSQAKLADAMTARGIPWHQQTVGRVESGQQQVRFAELKALAAEFGTTLDRFAWTSREAHAAAFVHEAGKQVRVSAVAVADAVAGLLASLAAAEQALASTAPAAACPRVQEAHKDLAGQMDLYSVAGAVEEGRRRYEERKDG